MTIKTALKKESINICTFLFSQTYTVFWHLLFVWCVVTMPRGLLHNVIHAVRLRPLSCKVSSCCASCSDVYTRSLAHSRSEWSMFVVLLGSRVILLIHIWQFVSRWTLVLCWGRLTKIMCVLIIPLICLLAHHCSKCLMIYSESLTIIVVVYLGICWVGWWRHNTFAPPLCRAYTHTQTHTSKWRFMRFLRDYLHWIINRLRWEAGIEFRQKLLCQLLMYSPACMTCNTHFQWPHWIY